jgi:hypothetical protein
MDTMTNRHFYKSAETGIVAAMNDSFAAVFGDRLSRVDDPSTEETVIDTPAADAAPAEPSAANPDNLTASTKEDN